MTEHPSDGQTPPPPHGPPAQLPPVQQNGPARRGFSHQEAFTLAAACFVVLAFVGLFASGAADPRSDASKQQATGAVAASKKPAPATATGEPSPTAAATPAVKTRIATETKPIPHGTMRVKDSSLRMGVTIVRTEGVDGERTLTYQVTVANSVETARKLVKSEVTVAPVTEVIATGTRRCHPNYAGECVPIADDVDCLRNGGNGPKYISGPVRVIGEDVYDLDRDGNGIGCEDD